MPQLPTEVLAVVLHHLRDDRKSLKRTSLASRYLCFLSQEHLFSTIDITDSTDIQKLLDIFLSSPRGDDIVLAIRTLSVRNIPRTYIVRSDFGVASLRVFQFIADHAKRLRAVHFGPFYGAKIFVWKLQSDEFMSILVRLFTMAEDIIIEGVTYFPASLFQTFSKLKSLDFSRSHLSLDFPSESPSLPSPQSLTFHDGVLGRHESSMFGSLSPFASRIISFSNLRVLYLYISISFAPGRDALYRELISLCDCRRLESLRFYIEGDDTMDPNINGPIIDLSLLTNLQSLYVIVNVNDSLGCLANIVNTISLPQTHLKDLCLFIDTQDSDMEDDDWLEETMTEVESHSEAWKSLDSKLAQIFKAWSDTYVVIQFPPVDPTLNEEVHYFIEEQMPEISEYMHRRFQILDLNFRNIVTPYFSFRDDDDQARILDDYFRNTS